MTPLPISPFVDPDRRFVLDVDRFLADVLLGPAPVFLSDPSPAYLTAVELEPLCEVLTMYK